MEKLLPGGKKKCRHCERPKDVACARCGCALCWKHRHEELAGKAWDRTAYCSSCLEIIRESDK